MKTKKIIKRGLYEYALAEWDGENESGFRPIGDSVLVLVDIATTQTLRGLEIDPGTVEKQQIMCDTGVIIAVAEGAFVWSPDRTRQWAGQRPAPGDRVVFERYAGRDVPGNDDRYYRVMTDKSLFAIHEPKVVAEAKIADAKEAEAKDAMRVDRARDINSEQAA